MAKKSKPQVRTMALSFNKSELFKLSIAQAGVSMPNVDTRSFAPDKETQGFKNMQQFGFWGGSNNANTFYPGLNVPKDVMPQPEDFIEVPFRLLSATIVGADSWKATDFTDVGVLKASKDKLLEKPVYFDHDTDLLNWLGLVKSIKWSNGFTNSDGIAVPPGIDGVLSIDAKCNPKIARGLAQGAIFSNSVTVLFDWIPSHTFESGYEFDNKVGDMGPDGTMVRRLVTKIHDYYETSLVWLGADPFSKLIDKDGNLKNIDASSISYDKVDAAIKAAYDNKKYTITYGFDKGVLSLTKKEKLNNPKDNPMKDAILAQLAVMLGVTVESLTVDSVKALKLLKSEDEVANTANAAAAAMLKESLTSYATANKLDAQGIDVKEFLTKHSFAANDAIALSAENATKVAELTTEVTTLKKTVETQEGEAKAGRQYISDKRAETVRLYKAHAGEKVDETIVSLINEAKPEHLEGLLKQYCKDATGKFSGVCKDCNSTNFEFRSTVSEGKTKDDNNENTETGTASFEDLHSKFSNDSMDILKKKEETK